MANWGQVWLLHCFHSFKNLWYRWYKCDRHILTSLIFLAQIILSKSRRWAVFFSPLFFLDNCEPKYFPKFPTSPPHWQVKAVWPQKKCMGCSYAYQHASVFSHFIFIFRIHLQLDPSMKCVPCSDWLNL